ncbi:Leucine Rich Repeat family protein [Trichomonas vaginalis G3]|uniref:Leucine Rich Repeat family protein n=1 Tax=Trichomonas vaginalis (strain ATCC PRA-98 / G3) TaxID=412133 RepID=A2ECK1_TRIV3|nr:uncharacterized protein TVAGG3_0881890 [Trichomonas vaginalis G3]EAY09598.1 Leucine Rich Repeat family protein [Trichomonas vaginalis G3]KAI5502110.1 interleukin-8 biosynthetic process [Trichomonas vaginalis G3]|eukprot:XP_001321821.1 hypothetical protein [Trichomonas vaginalis G3]
MAEETVQFEDIDLGQAVRLEKSKSDPLVITNTFSEEELKSIFIAKSQDFNISTSDKMFQRFYINQMKKPFLKIFDMSSSSIGPKATEVICSLILNHPHIRSINLSGNSIGNKGATSIAQFLLQTTKIISLDLSSNAILDKGLYAIFYALKSNPSVISLKIGSTSSVARNSVGQSAAKELASTLSMNQVLSELDLSMAKITCDLMIHISKGLELNHSLQVLNISNNNICSKGCRKVLQAILNSNIVDLNISNNAIKDDIAPDFIKYISKNKSIKRLNISNNQLTKAFTKAITPAFANYSELIEFNLSHNPLTGAGIDEFGPALAMNLKIKTLNISMCQIDNNGFKSFCKKLAENYSLTTLILSHNPIGDEGAKNFAEVIKEHPILKEIDLEMTEITDVGGDVLIPALGASKSIEKVSFRNNLLGNPKVISKALMDNTLLYYFDIDYNDIEYKYHADIEKLIKSNQKLRKERKENKIKREVQSTKDVDARLHLTRQEISEEREQIQSYSDDLVKAKEEFKTASESRNTTIKALTTKFDEINGVQNGKSDTYREAIGNLQNSKEVLEYNLRSLQQQLQSEIEVNKRDMTAMGQLENKLFETQKTNEMEISDVIKKLLEAKQKYLDAKEILLEAWNTSHVFVTSGHDTATPKKTNRETTRNTKRSSRKKISGSDSKGKVNDKFPSSRPVD